MEATITPIEDVLPQTQPMREPESDPVEQESHYLPPDFYQRQAPPPSDFYHVVQPQNQEEKNTHGFPDFDKFTYVVIFVAFIIGFFMGKSGHPIILKHG